MHNLIRILVSIVIFLSVVNCYSEEYDNIFMKLHGKWHSVPQNSAARYMANQVANFPPHNLFRLKYHIDQDGKSLCDTKKQLEELIKNIVLGENWKESLKHINLPKINDFTLSGDLLDKTWESAYKFSGEYDLNSPKINDKRTKWKIAYSDKYLYCGVQFYDSEVVLKEPEIWTGDSLEFFICPVFKNKVYREIVARHDGKSFNALHANNRYGSFVTMDITYPKDISLVKCKGSRTIDGYIIEIKIPWVLVPEYTKGNTPLSGDHINFMLVRTNLQKNNYTITSVVPLLYGGHNLWGYISATLQ